MDECNWTGIVCNSNGTSVLELNTTSPTTFKLQGTIPTELGLLSNLRNLSFYQQNLKGALPTELSKLANLRSVDLRLNSLTSLSGVLEHWQHLQVLHIGENHLQGYQVNASALAASSQTLQVLNVDNNPALQLDDLFVANVTWPTLQYVGISNTLVKASFNSIVGTKFPVLETIDAANVPWQGSVPASIGTLTALKSLNLVNPLNGGQLTGQLPTELGLLTSLVFLTLDNTMLHSTLPTELGRLQQLTLMSLNMVADLTGTIPTGTYCI
jgi:Leucine-rich repeat (LRR) protein